MTDWNGASSLHLWLKDPAARPALAIETKFRVTNMPTNKELVFWALAASLPNGDGFHMGLQWHPMADVEKAINFGGYKANAGPELTGTPLNLEWADGNSNTAHFPWIPDHEYTLRLAKTERGFGAWIDDFLIRELFTDQATMQGAYLFTESFQPCGDNFQSCAWKEVFITDTMGYKWQITDFVATYQSQPDQVCKNTSSWVYVDDIWQATGINRMNADNTTLSVPKVGQAPATFDNRLH